MAFTRNPNYLWNDKPLSNCSHDELIEAVSTLMKENKDLKKGLRKSRRESSDSDAMSALGLRY